jgi:DNA-binding CsgD family transcriptional regulator
MSAWESALHHCTAFPVTVTAEAVGAFPTVVLDVQGLGQVAHLLPMPSASVVWVHGGIGPTEVRRARHSGIGVVVHRELGLAGVVDAIDGPPDAPRVRRLGTSVASVADVSLSLDEVAVLRLLSRGATAAQVRRETGLSASQVERCRRSAITKLDVHTTGQALGRAIELGLITVIGANPSA